MAIPTQGFAKTGGRLSSMAFGWIFSEVSWQTGWEMTRG